MRGCLLLVVVVFVVGIVVVVSNSGGDDGLDSRHDWTVEECAATRAVALGDGENAQDAAIDLAVHC